MAARKCTHGNESAASGGKHFFICIRICPAELTLARKIGIMNPAKTVCRNRVFRDGTGGFMEQKYDVIIIGAGPGGIFCAYELMEKNKGAHGGKGPSH